MAINTFKLFPQTLVLLNVYFVEYREKVSENNELGLVYTSSKNLSKNEPK